MRYLPIIVFLLAATGCQGYPFIHVEMGQTIESFNKSTITGNPNVDILFVIDNSRSMQDKQTNLANNANLFISEFSQSTLNYHLGIVTTDMFNPNDAGRLRMAVGASPTNQPFWSAPNPNDAHIDAERQAIVDGFKATVGILGINGNLNEAGLLAPIRALAPSDMSVAQANAGFLRSDADLAVIILTDEDDCSFTPQNYDTVQSWVDDQECYRNPAVLFDANTLISAYQNLKGDLGKVRLGIIAGGLKNADGTLAPRSCLTDNTTGTASDQCGCWVMSSEAYFCTAINTDYDQPCTSWCSGSDTNCASTPGGACDTPLCDSTPARRYVQFYTDLSLGRQSLGYAQGTVIDTVCQTDYASTLLSIAHNVVLSSCFSVPTQTTDPNAIAVSISHGPGQGSIDDAQVLPRYDPQDPNAACHSCADCPQGAWQFSAASGVCLACGLELKQGDSLSVGTISANTRN